MTTITFQNLTGSNLNFAIDGSAVVLPAGSSQFECSTNLTFGSWSHTFHSMNLAVIQIMPNQNPVICDTFDWQYPFWLGAAHGSTLSLVMAALMIYRRFGQVIVKGGD